MCHRMEEAIQQQQQQQQQHSLKSELVPDLDEFSRLPKTATSLYSAISPKTIYYRKIQRASTYLSIFGIPGGALED